VEKSQHGRYFSYRFSGITFSQGLKHLVDFVYLEVLLCKIIGVERKIICGVYVFQFDLQ